VTNKRNGKSVVVRINDSGPFIKGRIIDVTPSAACALGFAGLAPVAVMVVTSLTNVAELVHRQAYNRAGR
jgi:rare lipoprotein A